jgi:hypothetical protein
VFHEVSALIIAVHMDFLFVPMLIEFDLAKHFTFLIIFYFQAD